MYRIERSTIINNSIYQSIRHYVIKVLSSQTTLLSLALALVFTAVSLAYTSTVNAFFQIVSIMSKYYFSFSFLNAFLKVSIRLSFLGVVSKLSSSTSSISYINNVTIRERKLLLTRFFVKKNLGLSFETFTIVQYLASRKREQSRYSPSLFTSQ